MTAFRTRVVALTLALVVLAGCSGGSSTSRADRSPSINVGSFAFSESVVLAEVYSQALEAAGFTVTRVFQLAAREIVEPALEQGKIDLVPDYLGTTLAFVSPTARQPGDSEADLLVRARDA